MLRLRKILLYNYLYFVILSIGLIITAVRVNLPIKSNYKLSDTKIIGIVTNIDIDGNKLDIIINGKEKIKAYYYFDSLEEKERISNLINLGDKVLLTGQLNKIEKNKTEELFDYKKYMKTKGINYIQEIEEITILKKNSNIFYKIKQLIVKRCNNTYLKVFVLGDKTKVSTDITNSYRDLGISHLFAISGMHITLLSSYLLKLLKKLKVREEKRYFIVSIFLLFYLFITGVSASILRSILFFIFFSINKVYYFYIKSTNIFILVFSISLFINPYYIYDVAFLYSFSISFSLIVMGNYINSYNSYIKKLFLTSIISFIVSIPITLYNFNQINFLSIIYNIFYVPYISIIVFPLSLLTFIFPFLENLFNIFIMILENSCLLLSKINFLKLVFCNNNIIFYFGYVVLVIVLLIGLFKKKYYYIIFLIIVLVFHYLQPFVFNKDYLMMLDVGQGDSIIIHSDNKTILIDTGGIMSYSSEDWQKKIKNNSIVLNTTIPMLKKLGINKLDYLILTHGDYDHMGEAINLVNNFKVEKVIFNNDDYNYLELDLIEVLKKKEIMYYQNVQELNIGSNKLYFLNNYIYDNENDNSNVIYAEINKIKILLMGDAGIKVEKDIIGSYDLKDIDILKVGHHGSKTSSSKEFINNVNPKYSLISVGEDNKFGHPNKIVLENLEDSIIYRTDIDGSIMFKIKNNKLKIQT